MHGSSPRGNPPLSSIIRSHQLVVLHPARKLLLPQRRRVRPRLQPVLLPDRRRETARPLLPRVMLHHVLNRPLVHQLRITAHVVYTVCLCQPPPLALSFPATMAWDRIGRCVWTHRTP